MTVRLIRRLLPPALRDRRLALIGLALALAAVAAAVAGPVAAQSDEEIVEDRKARRQELQAAAAAATASLDAATADAEDLIDALHKAQAAVDAQQTALAEAERAVAEAAAVIVEAENRIVELENQLAATEERLRKAVIDSYVSLQAQDGTFSVVGEDPWENARKEALAGFAAGSRVDDIDELRRLGEELERWRLVAVEAAEAAEADRQDVALILADLRTAVDREAALAVAAEERVERRLYEVQTIKQIDAGYAAEIEAAERRIAEALARQRAEEEARRRAEEARRRAEEARRRAEEDAARQDPGESVDPADADFTLVWVRGFQVNSQIAADVEGLLAALESEGFDMGGQGYRSHEEQIILRRANCGPSDYETWEVPARHCRPPTARPGRSNHEKGLAIDFTESGRLITSRSRPVFNALTRLAPQYGLQNLPVEPWHWSVDGR